MASFAQLIASRYFVLGKRRGWTVFIPLLVMVGLVLLASAIAYGLYHARSMRVQQWRADTTALSRSGMASTLPTISGSRSDAMSRLWYAIPVADLTKRPRNPSPVPTSNIDSGLKARISRIWK